MIVVSEGVANGINHYPENKIFPSIPVHLENNKIKEIIIEKRWCYLPDIVAIKKKNINSIFIGGKRVEREIIFNSIDDFSQRHHWNIIDESIWDTDISLEEFIKHIKYAIIIKKNNYVDMVIDAKWQDKNSKDLTISTQAINKLKGDAKLLAAKTSYIMTLNYSTVPHATCIDEFSYKKYNNTDPGEAIYLWKLDTYTQPDLMKRHTFLAKVNRFKGE